MREQVRRPSPAMGVALVALFTALGGGAYAASQIDTADIAPQAVTGGKIAKETIRGSKLRADTVTGAKINESTLGEVPNAANAQNAVTACNLSGQQSFYFGMARGDSVEIAANGSVSLTALCDSVVGTRDRVRIVAATTQPSAILDGRDDLTGTDFNGKFLEPTTAADDRELLASTNSAPGQTLVQNSIDQGFVLGADNKALTIDGETAILGLNYGGAACIVGGVVHKLG